MKNWLKSSGFTLAEVLIIAPIVILVIGTFVVFIINITGEVIKTKASVDTIGDTQNALRYMQSDIRLSTGFADTTGTVTNPQGSGDDTAAWTNSGTSSTNLILTRIATTYSPINPNSLIVYTNSPYDCTAGNREQNTAYTYYSVYFVSGGSLWQRNVMKNYPTVLTSLCSTPWQLPSCTLANVTAVPAICKVQDTEVATNVTSLNVQYYNSSGTATSTRSDTTNVKITLNTSKAAAGKTLTSSDELRAAKRGSDLPAIVETNNPASWTACPMSNSWTTYTGYPTLSYTKTSTGTVAMSGFFMKTAAPVADEIMCTLPTGYRPSTRLIFQLAGGGGAARVDVTTNGEVRYESGGGPSPSWVSVTGINFLSSTTAPIGSWTSMTAYNLPSYNNGWVSFDNGATFGVPALRKDSSGRAWVQGLAKSGCTTTNCGAYILPTGYGINSYECLIYPAWNSAVAGSMSPQGSTMIFRYGSNSYWSLQAMYYPDGAIQWTTPVLQNNWTAYTGCWGSAAYVKNVDNIVSLKGLIKSGATTGTIFTLPAGYRPSRTDAYCNVNSGNGTNDGHAALWIQTNGNVDISSGVYANWLSLSGCNFVAEQ